MASERHNEKTMRNPEDHEEDFSNNLGSGTKPKKVLPSSQQYPDTPKKTLTEGFHSKNEEIPSGRTQFQVENDSVPLQKEKNDMLLKEHKDINGGTQDCDLSKRIAAEEAKTSDYTAPKNTPLPFYRPGEKNTSTFPNNNPSNLAPDKKKVLPSSQQYPDPPQKTLTEGLHSKNEEIPASGRSPQFQAENDSVPQQKEKNDMLLMKEQKDMINGGTQDCDPSKMIATEDQAKTSDYTATKNTSLPLYRPGENSTTSTFPNSAPPHQDKEDSAQKNSWFHRYCCCCCSIL